MHDGTPRSSDPPLDPVPGQRAALPPEPAPAPAEEDDDLIIVGAGLDLADPNSPLAPLYFRTTHVVLVALLAVFFAAFTHLPLWHTDVWAHLRFGQEIVKDLLHDYHLPRHEPFPESPVDKEAEYIHYQWVAQAGAYLIYEAGAALSPPDSDHRLGGGALLLVTTHALLLVLRLALLYLAFHRLTGSPPAALCGVVLVIAMSAFVHLPILRPQVLGELGFAAVLLAVSRPVVSRRALIAVPLVFLLWANCHGTFVMGFVLLGAVLAGRAVEVVWGEDRSLAALTAVLRGARAAVRALSSDVQFRRVLWLVIASMLATLVNPHGPMLLYRSYTVAQNPNIATMEEWKPLPYLNAVHTVFLGSVLVLGVLLRLSPRRFTPTQILLLVGFGLQSVVHARMVVWWIMVFGWVAVPHLHAVAGRYLKLPWLDDPSLPSLRKTVLAAALAAMLLLWSRPAWWLLWGEAPVAEGRVRPATPIHVLEQVRTADPTRALGGWLAAGSPLEAAALARTESALRGPDWQDRPRLIFCSEGIGDYLLWEARLPAAGPPIRLSCYTHVHLFSKSDWDQCIQVKNADRNWQAILDALGADFLVLEDDQYEQANHRAAGKAPGFSNLIDRVRAADDRWQILSEAGQPVFVAQRIR